MTPIELSINFLKEQLTAAGKVWKENQDKEKMRDCLALVNAINELEEREFGERITDITFVM